MKQISHIGLGIFLLAVFNGCQSQKQTEFTLEGSIKGVSEGRIILVQSNDEDRTSDTIGNTELVNGSFKMEGILQRPGMVSLVVKPGNWHLSLFMENSDIRIDADTTGAEHYDYTAHGGDRGALLKTFTVEGSKSHEEFRSFEEDPQNKAFKEKFAAINSRYNQVDESEHESLQEQSEALRQEYVQWEVAWIDSFAHANPSSVVGPYLFLNHYQFNNDMSLEQMERTMALFKGDAIQSKDYKRLDEKLQQRLALQPGKDAPMFTALKPDSTEFDLASLKGKYVLLDFWASWCIPCRKSIPHWKELYNDYKDKGFEIVGVTNDSRWTDWKKALEEEKMPWIQVADDYPVERMPARIATMYMAPYLPSYTLIDPDGKIVLHNGSKEDITKTIQERIN